jgi:beta-glucanase (GH16 family)
MSARIIKLDCKHGKVEVRAKLPTGIGTWPAIWMLGKNINEDGAYWDNLGYGTTPWPACGEIDIMEHWGSNQNYVQSAMHTPSSFGATENHGGQVIPTASTAFHNYTLEWYPDKMVFAVDGNVHYTYQPDEYNADTWPFDAEQYLLLNIAIEGSIDPAFTEGAMEIEYIRVYQQATISKNEIEQIKKVKAYPNPVKNRITINLKQPVEKTAIIHWYNTTGKCIRTDETFTTGSHIVIENINVPKGVYFLQIISGNNVFSIKTIKE